MYENELYKEELTLPFKDQKVEISQGFNGEYTHRKIRTNNDQSYSIDFVLPVGTPVLASKAGIVKEFFSEIKDYYEGENFNKGIKYLANYITIKHPDETFTNYQHFGFNNVYVKEGEKIKEGQILGLTGKSGWIGPQPHLHFSLYIMIKRKVQPYTQYQSMPFCFKEYSGPLEDKDLKADLRIF